jgi:hypothetical protein
LPQPRYLTYGSAQKWLGLLSNLAIRSSARADPAQVCKSRSLVACASQSIPRPRALYSVRRRILRDLPEYHTIAGEGDLQAFSLTVQVALSLTPLAQVPAGIPVIRAERQAPRAAELVGTGALLGRRGPHGILRCRL